MGRFRFDPTGARFVTYGGTGDIRLRDGQTGDLISPLHGHSPGWSAWRFSPDGNRLASIDSAGTIILWNSHTGREQFRLRGQLPPPPLRDLRSHGPTPGCLCRAQSNRRVGRDHPPGQQSRGGVHAVGQRLSRMGG